MIEATTYVKCDNCGAVTITDTNGTSYSMRNSTFNRLRKEGSISIVGEKLQNYYICDHCVNKFGIDLCSCGSGAPVGKCSCGSKRASQTLGEVTVRPILF